MENKVYQIKITINPYKGTHRVSYKVHYKYNNSRVVIPPNTLAYREKSGIVQDIIYYSNFIGTKDECIEVYNKFLKKYKRSQINALTEYFKPITIKSFDY